MISKQPHLNSVGQTYRNFVVTRFLEIPELDCVLRELVHTPTQAKVLHIANDDPENVFCLSFQTLPDSSKGTAHILEHTVLCGSKKFPVKDPFFAMQKRSLNTFMNAFTGPDFTCYPAATQVPKDFYNLLEVYLDAVFNPILNEKSFLQEGHRLEFSDPENPESPLEVKGIVFNEMKGALSSPHARLSEEMNAALFPNVTYGWNSGGDPKAIPTLTYDELVKFHENYYHPSRCLFYFYGNMPLEGHLDFIAKETLDKTKPLQPLEPIPMQPRYTSPLELEKQYPISPEEDLEDKTLISFGYLTCPIREQLEILSLTVLVLILMDTDASPLKMALMKSGLCKQVTAHLEADINELPIVFTLNGCKSDSADKLEMIIKTTLQRIAREGIPLDLFESAIHQMEFHRSEIAGDHAPFGLTLFMRSGLLKQHGVNPEDGLKIHSYFEKLRQKTLEDPSYLTGLITKYFLENPHRVRLSMHPDKTLSMKELSEEKELLAKIKETLTSEDKQQLVDQAISLKRFQKEQEEESEEILPKVLKEDIPRYVKDYPLHKEPYGNLNVFHHACFTNEIVYADLSYSLPEIPQEDLPLIRLFANLLPQLGSGGRTYAENLEYIQGNTGGVSASLTFNLRAESLDKFTPSICLRGKALHRKVPKMMMLIGDMASSANFKDPSRIKEILHKHYTSLQSSLTQSALKYAINLSSSGLDAASYITSAWYGLDYYYYMKDLIQNLDSKLQTLIDKLHDYREKLLCLADPHLILGCDTATYHEMKGHGFYGLGDLEAKSFKPWSLDYQIKAVEPQGRIIASPVAFTAVVFRTIPYIHPDSSALLVASHLFDNLMLHAKIREQGGAYGGGAVANNMGGTFYFYAYRDPNIASSLQAFQDSIEQVLKGDFEEADLEEAVLEIIQGFDSPVSPGSRADLAYGWFREGKPVEVRQAYRDRLLKLTKEDVIAAVSRHIAPQLPLGAPVSFASKELLEKENAILAGMGKPSLKIDKI